MEDNKLIAEFMGAKPIVLGISTEYEMYGIIECINDGVDEKHFFIDDEMEFHTSWDWLMPVVKKISSCIEEPFDLDNLKYAFLSDNIEVVHSEVVELIKELNKK